MSFRLQGMYIFICLRTSVSGKTIILKYISDSLGTDDEMKVHKFAEEAMYKYIAHGWMHMRWITLALFVVYSYYI